MDSPSVSRSVINNARRNACPFCSSQDVSSLGGIGYSSPILFSTTWIVTSLAPELWECRQCQSKFTQNSVTEQDATDLYSSGNSGDRWQAIQFIEHQCSEVVHAMESILQPKLIVIDVGCNTGEFLDFAKSKGCETGGVEFSHDSRGILKDKGHSAYSHLNEIENCSVDVISAFDLVEHLYNPTEFMTACSDKLKLGGRMVIVTGNAMCIGARLSGSRWWYVSFPEHIVFPSKKFFARYVSFKLEKIIDTYAGQRYRRPRREIARCLIKGIIKGNYNAAPSIGPDHMLVVLQKIK